MSGALAATSGVLAATEAFAGVGAPGGSWKRLLRQASFRGVPFHFDRVSHSYGRRFAMHEYPGRDTPWAEPLGRRQRSWTVAAYLIGDAYPGERERLRRVCEDDDSPGTLILPLVGRVTAICTEFAFDDARERGRHSGLAITFVESGERLSPVGYEDTRSLIALAAQQLSGTESAWFLSGFSVGSPYTQVALPFTAPPIGLTIAATGLLASAAAANVVALGERLEALRLANYARGQAELGAAIAVLVKRADQLVYDAEALYAAADTAFAAYTEAMTAEIAFIGMLTLASTYEARKAPPAAGEPSTPELRAAEQRNARLFQGLVRRLALREIGYAVPGIDLDNTGRAIETRQTVFDAFMAELEGAGAEHTDDIFRALADLAHQILDDIDNRAAQLPALTTYRTARSVNAITLAYRLYADPGRNLDIVARTGAINPAFMPLAGRVLDQ